MVSYNILYMSGVLNSIPSLTGTMDKVKGLLFNKKFLIIMVVVVIFLAVAFYVYNTYVAPRINPDFVPNREFDDDGHDKNATLYFFSVDWCPYSKKAKPIWKKIKKAFDGKQINNITLNLKEIDGEKQETELENFENEYLVPNDKKIDGYPSIWMVKGEQIIEYSAKPDVNSLTEFINTML
jgi:thiol-disulfide isomerase/thioredoxin